MPGRDWRSKAAYDDLDTAPLRTLAWEFLRRNPDYARDYEEAMALPDNGRRDVVAAHWGLRFPVESGPSGSARTNLLGPRREPRHHRLVGAAAMLLASIVSCASGCDLVTARD